VRGGKNIPRADRYLYQNVGLVTYLLAASSLHTVVFWKAVKYVLVFALEEVMDIKCYPRPRQADDDIYVEALLRLI
jgi:hypothetical protein